MNYEVDAIYLMCLMSVTVFDLFFRKRETLSATWCIILIMETVIFLWSQKKLHLVQPAAVIVLEYFYWKNESYLVYL